MKDDIKTPLHREAIPQVFDQLSQKRTEDIDIGDRVDSEFIELTDQKDNQTEATKHELALEEGRLPPEARRALIRLLRQGVILADQKRLLFEALCRNEKSIREHLADMYLRLSLDQKAGVAILIQQSIEDNDEEEDEIISLISRKPLNLYDTLLLLVLRKFYQERESSGAQRIFIDIEQLEALLTPFLPLTNSSRSDRQQLKNACDRMNKHRILNKARGDSDRLEITPVIRYVVNAEFLEVMLIKYQELVETVNPEGKDE